MTRIVGHGIDMIECSRVQDLAERYGERFLARVFTPAEIDYCRARKRSREHLAGRFAVKEAVLKALGTGWRGQIAWTDIEVANDEFGRPAVRLTGHTLQLAREKGIREFHISISHTAGFALASAIALAD